MSTLTAVVEPDINGTIHILMPKEMRGGKVKIVAMLERVTPAEGTKEYPTVVNRKAGSLAGEIWMSPDFDEPLEEFKEYME
jgi:hypothetical protein